MEARNEFRARCALLACSSHIARLAFPCPTPSSTITMLLPALLADPRSPLLPCAQVLTGAYPGHGEAAQSKQSRRSAPRNLLRLRCADHPSNTRCCLRPSRAACPPGILAATSHVVRLPTCVAHRGLTGCRQRAGKGRGQDRVRSRAELEETLHGEPPRGLLRGGAAVGVAAVGRPLRCFGSPLERAARARARAPVLLGGLGGAEGWAARLGRGWPGVRRAGRVTAVARRRRRAAPRGAAGTPGRPRRWRSEEAAGGG